MDPHQDPHQHGPYLVLTNEGGALIARYATLAGATERCRYERATEFPWAVIYNDWTHRLELVSR